MDLAPVLSAEIPRKKIEEENRKVSGYARP
jgi:hypothetical protein